MTTFYLIRHCSVDALGRYLAGRTAGERLNATGLAEARRLEDRFAGYTFDAVYSSPLERATQTAAALRACVQNGVQCANELIEIDFGDWTGKPFDELAGDETWARFNTRRSETRIPGGELIADVQQRAVGFVERVAREHPNGTVAVVSHGDVLRSVLTHFLGMPLDGMQRFEIAPGSVSVVELWGADARVVSMNVTL